MYAIARYLLTQLVAVTVFVTVGLTFAIWLTQSLRLIDFIVNRGLPATTFFSFVGLLLPSFIGIVLPISTFCAVLFVYNKLAMDSELVVMRAIGQSQLQLARPALILGALATACVYAITLYFLPLSFRSFKDLQHEIRNDYSTVLLQEGTFNTLSEGITVYVRERSPSGELRGILVHDNRKRDQPVSVMAERGALVSSESGPRVVMVNGNRQEVDRANGRLSLLYFDSYSIELSNIRDAPLARWREPKERYLPALLYPDNSKDDQRFKNELIAEGHQRLVMPLYTMAFVLVGLAALLSGEFNRRGQANRLIIAILCIAGLEALSLALHDLGGRTLSAIPIMYAAAILPSLISLFILLHNPRRRPSANGPAVGAPA